MSPLQQILAACRAFCQAGRDLAHWHMNYETMECFPGVVVEASKERGHSCSPLPANEPLQDSQTKIATGVSHLLNADCRVNKMKFAKRKGTGNRQERD